MHFVKHSLIVAMLAVLTGCGGNSSNPPASSGGNSEAPAEKITVVSSVSPQSAVIGVLTTFTLSGANMNNKMQVSLPNCQNISALSGSTSRVTFTCTPQTESNPTLTVKNEAGATLLTNAIKFQTTANTDDVSVSELEIPSVVTVGEIATFVVKGQNLSNTLPISLPQCTNITRTSISPTQIVFTCTPQTAGTQILKVSNENGEELRSGNVIIQNPAPTLTGSWRKTAANGCASTDSISGEGIIGARSKMPLFTFIKDSDTQVRLMGNEGISYLSTDCSETTQSTTNTTATPPAQFALMTGVARFAAVYDNIGEVKQTSGLNYYYPVNTKYNNGSLPVSNTTAIVFKDNNKFCLFDGTVTPANINTFIQSITANTTGCFTRSSNTPFSRTTPFRSPITYQYQLSLRNNNANIISALDNLNQRGQSGYILLRDASLILPEIGSDSASTYDIFTQIEPLSDYKFEYTTRDEPVQDADFVRNRRQQLNELGSQGWLFLGRRQLSNISDPKTLYVKAVPPQLLTSAPRFSYAIRTDQDINGEKLSNILNTVGAEGCRFVDIRPQASPQNSHATTCVKSNQHTGTFQYRYVAYPESTRADALKNLLDTQRSGGFYPIRVIRLHDDAPRILFERSSISTNIQFIEYKVYSQALPNNKPELDSLLNDQGKLGWHLWSQINDPSGNHLATIFANLPFAHLPDGEPVVLDRTGF